MGLELWWRWWGNTLTDEQRDRLMTESGRTLPPDFALEIWRTSGPVHVVEQERWDMTPEPNTWRLTAEAEAFIADRKSELSHREWQFG